MDPSGARQVSSSERARATSTATMRATVTGWTGAGGGAPVAEGASACAPACRAGSFAAAGSAPSGAPWGGSGGSGWTASNGRMTASAPAFRSPADTATCRTLGNSRARAIRERRYPIDRTWESEARPVHCATVRIGPPSAPPERERATDCIPGMRTQDCSAGAGVWRRRTAATTTVLWARRSFELFSKAEDTMNQFFETLAQHWRGGGFGMYPIAICLVFAIAVIIDRIQVLFFSASVDKEQFLRGLKAHIFNGDLDKAISYTAGQKPTPLTNIVKAGLINVPKGEDEVQAAMDEASLREDRKSTRLNSSH